MEKLQPARLKRTEHGKNTVKICFICTVVSNIKLIKQLIAFLAFLIFEIALWTIQLKVHCVIFRMIYRQKCNIIYITMFSEEYKDLT